MKKMMKLINFEKKCLESWIYFVLYTPDKWLKTTLKYIFPELPIVKHTGFRMEYDKQKSQIDLLLPTGASYLLKDNELLPQPENFTSFEKNLEFLYNSANDIIMNSPPLGTESNEIKFFTMVQLLLGKRFFPRHLPMEEPPLKRRRMNK